MISSPRLSRGRSQFFKTPYLPLLLVSLSQPAHNNVNFQVIHRVLSAAERRGTPVLLSATVSDNSGNSPQVAAPRRPREINQSTQRCSLLDQIHTLSCTKQK